MKFGARPWTGPYDAGLKARAVSALERGAVLFSPTCPFCSPNRKTVSGCAVSDGQAKNISLDHTTGKMQASSLSGEKARDLAAMIERFGSQAATLVQVLPYRNVERARTSFRPVEVKGRHYSKISDDRLLHIDAFPSRPMRGRRILRFFANVAPDTPRRWQVGQPFEDFARVFLPRVGPHMPGKSWLYEKLGVTRGRRSQYDELMLSLHDASKLDQEFPEEQSAPANRISSRLLLAGLHRSGVACRLGRGIRLGADLPSRYRRDGREPQRAPVRVLEQAKRKDAGLEKRLAMAMRRFPAWRASG